MIEAEAARLAGALSAIDVSASSISADAGATYPSAYAWCKDTIRLGAAVRVLQAISGAGSVPEFWVSQLEARYRSLAVDGFSALGDAPRPSQLGPRSHVSTHDLSRGDLDLLSDVVPSFRKNDEL